MTRFTSQQIDIINEKTQIPKRWLEITKPTEDTYKLVNKLLNQGNYNGDFEEAENKICEYVVDSLNKGRLKPAATQEESETLKKYNSRVWELIARPRRPGSQATDDKNSKNDFQNKEKEKVESNNNTSDETVDKIITNENLEVPNNEKIKEGIKKIKEHYYVEERVILQIITNLCAGRHILLAGPIGTGKSELAKIIPKTFWNYEVQRETATYEWGGTDVVGGYKPREDGDGFERVDGCVTETVKESIDLKKENGKTKGKWLIIDEFNRADIDKAMGELFSSLVDGKLKDPKTGDDIQIPLDYRIIGTLNTQDRHFLNTLSSALYRRFAYIEVPITTDQDPSDEFRYALNNAIKKSKFSKRQLDKLLQHDANRINFVKPTYEKLFHKAYNIFQFVRNERKLGIAVLEAMFQTMLTRLSIRNDGENIVNATEAIDFALVSNIIPQLWNANTIFLESLKALVTQDLGVYFKERFDKIKQEQTQDFSKNAKPLAYFKKWIEDVKNDKNYFPIINKNQINSITKDLDLDKMIENFEKGARFEDPAQMDALKTIIQGEGEIIGKEKGGPVFFVNALDEQIMRTKFDD